MNWLPNPSPKTRVTPQIRILPANEEKDQLILTLQSKLNTLEQKYTKFVEKCSELLKSDHHNTDTREFFSECSSSVRFSPDLIVSKADIEENEHLIQYLNEIERGDLLKQHMNSITDLIAKSQESILDHFKEEKSHKDVIQNILTMLKSQLWELLFRKEEILKVTVKSCINKFQQFEKLLEDSLLASKYKRKMNDFKKRYLNTCEENEGLIEKIKEQHECLRKIKSDYSQLKQRVFQGSVLENEKLESKGRWTLDYQKDSFSKSSASSQGPDEKTNKVKKLKDLNLNLHNRVKILSHQNSILQHRKFSKNSDGKSNSIEIEKKEIQDQLKALNNKLLGFEKIAKNLIGSGIKVELDLVGQSEGKKLKNEKLLSPGQVSPLLDLLEADQVQKNFERVEAENGFLKGLLKAEKAKFEELWREAVDKDKKIKGLWEEVERKRKGHEEKMKESEGRIRVLADQIKDLQEKLRVAGDEKVDLDEIVNNLRENESQLNQNLKNLEKNNIQLQELLNDQKEQEDSSSLIASLYSSLKISTENCQKLQLDYDSLSSSYSALKKSQQSLFESLNNSEIKVNELTNLTKSLEMAQKDCKKAKSDLEQYKKTSEKIVNEKDKIIGSFELKNHENYKLTGEIINLQNEINEINIKNQELLNENESLNSKIEELNLFSASQEKIIENYEVENRETALKVKGLMDGLNEFKLAMKGCNEKVRIAEDEKRILMVENEKLCGKVRVFMSRCKSDEETLEILGNTVEEKDRYIEAMKARQRELEGKIEAMTLEINENNKKIEENSMNINEKNIEIEQKNKKINQIIKDIDDKNKEISDKIKEIDEKNKEIDEKTRIIAEKSKKNDEKNMEIVQNDKEVAIQVKEFENEIKVLKSELKASQELSAALSSEKSQLLNQLKSLHDHKNVCDKILSEKSVLIQSYEQTLQDLTTQNSDLSKNSDSISKTFEKDSIIQALQETLQQTKKNLDESHKQQIKLECDIKSLQESSNIYQNKLKALEDQLFSRNQLQVNHEKTISDYKATTKLLEKDLNTVQNDLEQAIGEIKKKQDLIDQLETDLACSSEALLLITQSSEKTITDLTIKLKSSTADIETLESSKVYLIEKHTKLQKTLEKDLKKSISNEQSLSLIIQNLTNTNETLKNDLKESQAYSKKLKYQLNRLNSTLKSLNLPALKHSFQDLSNYFKQKCSEYINSLKNPQNLSLFLTLFQIYDSGTKLEASQLVNTQSITQKKLEITEQEKENLRKDVNAQKDLLEKTLVEYTTLKGKMANLESDFSKLQQKDFKNNENLEIIQSLNGKLDSFKVNNHDLVIELEKYKKQIFDLGNLNEKLNLQANKAFQDNEQLKGDLEVYNMKVIEKNKQIEKLTEKLEAIKDESMDLKDYEKQILLKKQELHAINHENLILSKKLDEKNKYIEETSKTLNLIKGENEKLSKEMRLLKENNDNLLENLLEKDCSIKRLEDTVVSMENLLKTSEKTEEELRAALSMAQEKLDSKLETDHIPAFKLESLSPPAHPVHKDISRVSSINSKNGNNDKQSGYTDELNITPCKILRVIKAVGKKWVLCAGEAGEYIWKDENNLHVSGADTLLEAEEDMEEIKVALGEYYRGNILEAIESMKSKVNEMNLSAHFVDVERNEGFKGEFFGVGLDLSNIDIKIHDDNMDQLNNDLVNKNLELIAKDKKLEKKKRALTLLKEQNKVLKDQFRIFEDEKKERDYKTQSSMAVNLPYLKLVFSNLIGKVKVDKNIEDFVLVIFKILDFSQDEINNLQGQRKGKKVLKK